MNESDNQGQGQDRNRFIEIVKAFVEAQNSKIEPEKTEINNIEGDLKRTDFNPEFEMVKEDVIDPTASSSSLSPFKQCMNSLASNLKHRDLNILRTVLICRDSKEAKQLKMEMEMRNVNKILLVLDHTTVESVMPLWPEGFIQKFLIISENLLPRMHNKKIDLLILNEISADNFIQRVNPNCEILCIKDHRLIRQHINCTALEKSICPPFELHNPGPICPLNDRSQQLSSLKENIFTIGRHYVNSGIIAWSCYPLISCHYNTGVPHLSNAIRMSMKNMESPHDRARNVQRYAWPHLSSGYSMIMIGHEKCGKSWSYIPAICQRIYDATLKDDLDWTGPLCILVAANCHDGQNLSNALRNLLSVCSSNKMELIVTLWDSNFISEVEKNLSQPFGILLTTVDLLLQLHQMETTRYPLFHPENIRCLVLDNLGDMYRFYPIKTGMLMKWLTSTFDFKNQIQLIITSRLWMEKLMRSQLIPMLSDVLLVIEDGLEATAYGGVNLSVKFVSDGDYDDGQSLLKVLSGRDLETERIVIVCYRDVDCVKVCEMLLGNKLPHFYYDHGGNAQDQHIKSNHGIIVTLDDMLLRLNCGPVDLLINYTLTHTWHRFKQRFNIFHANYKAQVKQHGEGIVFLNPSETEQSWLFCDFLLKHDMDMPQEWLDHLYDFRLQKERLMPRLNSNLCMQLVIYGNCYRRTCRYRHEMRPDEVQPENHLPKHKGKLSFRVLQCNSPANLSIRLVEYTNSLAVVHEIQTFYEHEANRIQCINLSIGDICIVEHDNLYERVIITSIDLPLVKVRQLDWGTEHFSKNIAKLFVCDERFRNEKFQAIDMRLTGIMPHSMDRIWTDDVKRFIRYKFFNNIIGRTSSRDCIYTANVDFSFHNAVFVDNIFNEKGEDLRTFLTNNMKVFDDKLVKSRLLKILSNAQNSSVSNDI